ncbi:MAG: hypothetical protein ACP5SJ_01700 [Candidatus Micrarchaeia archaeon]
MLVYPAKAFIVPKLSKTYLKPSSKESIAVIITKGVNMEDLIKRGQNSEGGGTGDGSGGRIIWKRPVPL